MLWIWQLWFASFSLYHCQYMLGQCDELFRKLIQKFQLQTLLQYCYFFQKFLRFFVNFMFNTFNVEANLSSILLQFINFFIEGMLRCTHIILQWSKLWLQSFNFLFFFTKHSLNLIHKFFLKIRNQITFKWTKFLINFFVQLIHVSFFGSKLRLIMKINHKETNIRSILPYHY